MLRPRARTWALAAALAALAAPGSAFAISAEKARSEAQLSIANVERDIPTVRAVVARSKQAQATPEQRIASADILLRQKDYERTIDLLSQVLELHAQGKATETAVADATYLVGEAYFRDGQYLSARRRFREVVDRGSRAPWDQYAGRSLSRLVDVALRTDDASSLDDVLARMNQLPPTDATGSLPYARAKLYFARKDYGAAKSALGGVSAQSDWAHQAQYLLGAILVKENTPPPAAEVVEGAAPPEKDLAATRQRYAPAAEQFKRVTQLPAKTDAHRHVVDLAWMALGRLSYEAENYLDAAEAYSHVDRKSPEFANMLYELGWVYVRLGDYSRAQRALEVLAITDPGSAHFADGTLLRADLMLRSGQFANALELYQSVRADFDPVREKLSAFLASTTDPAVYYDRLVEDPLERGEEVVPELAIQWAREAAEGDRAFAVIDEVTRSRDLVKRSRRLVQKLNAVLGSSTRAKAFPELKAGFERALGLVNKVAVARMTLAQGVDDVSPGAGSGELADLRRERRALMKRIKWVPVTPGDFARRESRGEEQWNEVSQSLQRLSLEADRLQAIVNGLKRVLKDADDFDVTADANSRARFQAEIDANEQDLQLYRRRIRDFRDAIDLGRVQIGLGDQRYVDDARVRRRFREVFNREVQLVASGQAEGAAYARGIQAMLGRADAAEDQLERALGSLDEETLKRANEALAIVAKESGAVEGYSGQLDELDQQSRLLVGEMAMRNFAMVRDRLKSIVLRADVGIVQEAWEVREEQRVRVRDLQRERSREETTLNDELREVLDDAGDDE